MKSVPTYIVPTHKDKTYGFEAKFWKPFLLKVKDLDFGWHSWLRGLIMSGEKD
jgi:hypothetical protein